MKKRRVIIAILSGMGFSGNLYAMDSPPADLIELPKIKAVIIQGEVNAITSLREMLSYLPETTKKEIEFFVNDHFESDNKKMKELLFDLGLKWHDQEYLVKEKLTAFIRYLKTKAISAQEESHLNERLLYFKQSKGECAGLSTFWSYTKRIADEPKTNDKERDDIDFFNAMYKKLIMWDGTSELPEKDEKDLIRFVSQIIFFQMPIEESVGVGEKILSHKKFKFDQNKPEPSVQRLMHAPQVILDVTLEDTKRGSPDLIFSSHGFVYLSKIMLKEKLKTLVKSKKIVGVGARNYRGESEVKAHAMAIYQAADGKIFFYNPASEFGEICVKDFDALVENLWGACEPLSGGITSNVAEILLRKNFHAVSFEIFDFNKDASYPSVSDFVRITDTNDKAIDGWMFYWATKDEDIQSILARLSNKQILQILNRKEIRDGTVVLQDQGYKKEPSITIAVDWLMTGLKESTYGPEKVRLNDFSDQELVELMGIDAIKNNKSISLKLIPWITSNRQNTVSHLLAQTLGRNPYFDQIGMYAFQIETLADFEAFMARVRS